MYILATKENIVPDEIINSGVVSNTVSLADGVIYDILEKSSLKAERITQQLLRDGYSKIFEDCWISSAIKSRNDHPIYPIFFEKIAHKYDDLIDKNKNISCYDFCGDLVLRYQRTSQLRALDFGCGTGIITESKLYSKLETLIGIDSCQAMLEEAKKRGLETVRPQALEEMQQSSIDIIFSVYVLHYGVSLSTLLILVHLLAPHGKMIANIHKDIHLKEYQQWCMSLNPDDFNFKLQASEFGTILMITRLPY